MEKVILTTEEIERSENTDNIASIVFEKGEPEQATRKKEEETTETKSNEEAEKFLTHRERKYLEEILDFPGFKEFLRKKLGEDFDFFDQRNAKRIAELREPFELVKKEAPHLKIIIAEELAKIFGLGRGKGFPEIDSYLEDWVCEKPDEALRKIGQFSEVRQEKEYINDCQVELDIQTSRLPLKRITTGKEATQEMETVLTIANYFAFAGKEKRKQAREEIERVTGQKYSSSAKALYHEKINQQHSQSLGLMRRQQWLEEKEQKTALEDYEKVRAIIVDKLLHLPEVIQSIKDAIRDTVEQITTSFSSSIQSVNGAQNLLDKIIAWERHGTSPSIFDETEINDLQGKIDRVAQTIVQEQVDSIFRQLSPSAEGFGEVESKLREIIEKTKIGSKPRQEITHMIKVALLTTKESFNDTIIATKIASFVLANNL